MDLEERKEKARDDMCYYEIRDIRDSTDDLVAEAILCAKEFLRNVDNIDGIFALHQVECESIIDCIKGYTHGIRRDKTSTHVSLVTLVNNLAKRYKDMKATWSRLIQCAIDYDNATVFHEISEKVWATGEVVDEATNEAEEATGKEWEISIPMADLSQESPEKMRTATEVADESANENKEAIDISESPHIAESKNIWGRAAADESANEVK